jgi:hypothetical protein
MFNDHGGLGVKREGAEPAGCASGDQGNFAHLAGVFLARSGKMAKRQPPLRKFNS